MVIAEEWTGDHSPGESLLHELLRSHLRGQWICCLQWWICLFQELLWGSISVWQMDASPDFPKWFLEEVASCDVWSCYRTRVVVHKPDVSTLLLWYSLRAHFHTQWEEALRLCSTFFFPSHFVLSCFFISRKTQLSSSLFRSQHQKEKWLRSICFSTGVYIMTFLEVKLEMKPLV